MGKRVKVTTRCGEEHVYQYEQEVETVEIVEKKNYELQGRMDHIIELYGKGCSHVDCDDCAFHIDADNCAFVKVRGVLMKAQGYDK